MSETTGYAIHEGKTDDSVRITVNGQEICRARLDKLAMMYVMLHHEHAKVKAELFDLGHLVVQMETAAGGSPTEDFDEDKALKVVRDLRTERDELVAAMKDAEVVLGGISEHCFAVVDELEVDDHLQIWKAIERLRCRDKSNGGAK